MLLCKVMLNLVSPWLVILFFSYRINHIQPEDVNSLLTIKLALKYAQLRDVESMRAIARAHQNRNLADFEKALRDYKAGLKTFSFSSLMIFWDLQLSILKNFPRILPSAHTLLRCMTHCLNKICYESSSHIPWLKLHM